MSDIFIAQMKNLGLFFLDMLAEMIIGLIEAYEAISDFIEERKKRK